MTGNALHSIASRITSIRTRFVDYGYPQLYDELCECGHYRSHHTDAIDYGHGYCILCDCSQFTWVGFLVKQ
jgi:hypothetical protein